MNSRSNTPINNIVIVGGGAIGWSAAVGLARGLQGQGCQITLVDSATNESPLISVTPHVFDFHKIFGIQEKSLLQSGQAKLTSSQAFNFSNDPSDTVFNGFDTRLTEFHSFELHHVLNWLNISDYTPYSLAALASKHSRLALPTRDETGLRSSFTCGMNLNAAIYCQFMQGAAKQLGVKKCDAELETVSCNESTGFVETITLKDGTVLTPDLVIDNSGPDSAIFNQALNVPYQASPLSHIFNRQLIANYSGKATALPYASHKVTEYGWLETITMHNAKTCILSFNDEEFTDEQVLQHITELLGAPTTHFCKSIKLGKSEHFFHKNCVAIGSAAGYVGNPAVDNLILAQRAITKLLDLFPSRECRTYNQAEYNRRMNDDFMQCSDLQHLHLLWAKRNSKASWLTTLSEPTANLAQRTNLFKDTGRVSFELNPMIPRQTWVNLLQRCFGGEANTDPLLQAIDKNQAQRFIHQLEQQVRQLTEAFQQYR